jgi:hypothetical protein
MADKTEKVADAPKAPAAAKAPKARFDFTSLNSLAVVSLATAVTGFGAVAGVITGHIALKQIQDTKQSGRGLALAGLITGYVFVGLGIAGFLAGAWARGRGYEFGDHMGQRGLVPFGDQNGMMNFDQNGSQMGGHMDGSQMGGRMDDMMDDMGGQMGWGNVDVNPDQNATPTPTN